MLTMQLPVSQSPSVEADGLSLADLRAGLRHIGLPRQTAVHMGISRGRLAIAAAVLLSTIASSKIGLRHPVAHVASRANISLRITRVPYRRSAGRRQ